MSKAFLKNERLKSKAAFDLLFEQGKTAKAYPFRVVYTSWENDSPTGIQVGFSVPKRKFKRAVDRNRVKRQMREAYRLHFKPILTKPQQPIALLFIYLPHAKKPFSHMAEGMKKFAEILNKSSKHTFNKQ